MGTPDYIRGTAEWAECPYCNAKLEYFQTKSLDSRMDCYNLDNDRIIFSHNCWGEETENKTNKVLSGTIRIKSGCKCGASPTFDLFVRRGEIFAVQTMPLQIDGAEQRNTAKMLPKETDAFGVCRKCKKETWLRTWWWPDDTCSTRCSECGELQ